MDLVIQFLTDNAVPIGAAGALASIVGVALTLRPKRRDGSPQPPTQTATDGATAVQAGNNATTDGGTHTAGRDIRVGMDPAVIAERWVEEREARVNERFSFERQLEERDAEITALRDAVDALKQEPSESTESIDAALAQLEDGDTAAAEAIFTRIKDARRNEGEAALKDAAAAARHLGALAYLHDTEKALAAYGEAVELDPDNPEGWNWLGLANMRLGQFDVASLMLDHMMSLAKSANDDMAIAEANSALGMLHRKSGELGIAEEYHHEALCLYNSVEHSEGKAREYKNLGVIRLMQGDLDNAETYYGSALALCEELGHEEGIAREHKNLGLVQFNRGNLHQAEQHQRKALSINTSIGHKEGIASNFNSLSMIYELRGDFT